MRSPTLLPWLIGGLAAVDLSGRLGGPIGMPYAGSLTLLAVLAYGWLSAGVWALPAGRAWPRRALLFGLASLVAVAALVDGRTGGTGWPVALVQPAGGGRGAVEAALLLCAGLGTGAAVLGSVRRAGGRRRVVLAVAAGVLVGVVAGLLALAGAAGSELWHRETADVVALLVATVPLAATAITGTVTAVVVAGGRAGSPAVDRPAVRAAVLGGAALAALALAAVHPVAGDARFRGRLVPIRIEARGPDLWYPLRAVEARPPAVVAPPAPDRRESSVVRSAGRLDEYRSVSRWERGDVWSSPTPWGDLRPALVALAVLVAVLALVQLVAPGGPVVSGPSGACGVRDSRPRYWC